MLLFLRFVGILNAGLWLGLVVAALWVAIPSFAAPAMTRLLPAAYAEAASFIVLDRYYIFQYVFGILGLLHVLGEWLYAGKPLRRGPTLIVSVLLVLAIFQGAVVHQNVRKFHLEVHGVRSTLPQKQRAAASKRQWQTVGSATNLVTFAGLILYLWQVAAPGVVPRFASGKIRGLTKSVS